MCKIKDILYYILVLILSLLRFFEPIWMLDNFEFNKRDNAFFYNSKLRAIIRQIYDIN
jgi:hypothetical protein